MSLLLILLLTLLLILLFRLLRILLLRLLLKVITFCLALKSILSCSVRFDSAPIALSASASFKWASTTASFIDRFDVFKGASGDDDDVVDGNEDADDERVDEDGVEECVNE